jgi:predicted 2-oxoglutarate/Fe(II)-dependent dioxygenase YbiX/peroxiredoxin
LPSDVKPRFQLPAVGGRRLVLCFVPSIGKSPGREVAARLLAGAERFAKRGTGLIVVSADPAETAMKVPENVDGVRFLFDVKRVAVRLYGVAGAEGTFEPKSFILDERMHIVAIVPFETADAHVARTLTLYDALGETPNAHRALPQAPVLIVPGVFEPEFCAELIKGYAAGGARESGFMVERAGRTVEERDYNHKRRSDWVIENEATKTACRARMLRRLIPEIQRAYQFDVVWVERYIVACYDAASKGHFAAHRDNTTLGTAHRRFAVSLNLNEDYDGGNLIFPEFGRAHFKPPPGGACVFSCSLLHEATPVVSGKRYAFLPFLYDEAGQAIRDANAAFLDLVEHR